MAARHRAGRVKRTALPWVPILRQLIDSSVWESTAEVAKLWVTILMIANEPGRRGVIDMTVRSLAGRACLSPEATRQALEILTSPDPDSRSKAEDGRRLVPLDPRRPWGWRLVNHEDYESLRVQALATARVERFRSKRDVETKGTDGNASKRSVTGKRYSATKGNPEGEVEGEGEMEIGDRGGDGDPPTGGVRGGDDRSGKSESPQRDLLTESDPTPHPPPPRSTIESRPTFADCPLFEDFWTHYPRKDAKRAAIKRWDHLSAADRRKAVAGARQYALAVKGRPRDKIKLPDGWLLGRRWEDESLRAISPAGAPDEDELARVMRQKTERGRESTDR